MLLEALVACAGVTLSAVATAIERPDRPKAASTPRATSTSAARSASTRRRRSGFSDIRLRFELDTDADDEQLATLLKLTERYCVVFQTLTEAAAKLDAPQLTEGPHAAGPRRTRA